MTDRPLTEPESNNVSIATLHPSQFPSTFSLFGPPFSIPTVTTTVVPIAGTATSTEIVLYIQSTTSITVEASVGDHTPTSTTALTTLTNTNAIRISTSTLEAYFLTSSPTQSRSIEALLPISTTRITISTSIEQVSLSQVVIGTH